MFSLAAFDIPEQFPPRALLASVVGLGVLVSVIDSRRRSRRSKRLKRLAASWEMHYSQHDRVHLARRIADQPSLADASDLRVTDVVYGRQGDYHRYVFRLELTREAARSVRIARFDEPRGRAPVQTGASLEFAAADRPLLAQYELFAPPPRSSAM